MYSSRNCQIYAIGSTTVGLLTSTSSTSLVVVFSKVEPTINALSVNVQQAIHAQLKLIYFSIIGVPFGSL